jgi:hypothetical protein
MVDASDCVAPILFIYALCPYSRVSVVVSMLCMLVASNCNSDLVLAMR